MAEGDATIPAPDNAGKGLPALGPDWRADASAKAILSRLLAALEQAEAALLQGETGEWLHEFRVAVRRTRSALTQIKGVFPERRVRRFLGGFAALGQLSSQARDWEVFLQELDAQASQLPVTLRSGLRPLHELLAARHCAERRRLERHLRSAAYRRFKSDWRQFLEAPVPRRSSLANAGLPVRQVASRRIGKIYRRALKEGAAIAPDSLPEALHELRKTCKKLRYLMEFFQSLYPQKSVVRLLRILKALQDELGAYHDCQAQIAALLELAADSRRAAPAALMAMGALVLRLERRAAKARTAFERRFARLAAPRTRQRLAELLAAEAT